MGYAHLHDLPEDPGRKAQIAGRQGKEASAAHIDPEADDRAQDITKDRGDGGAPDLHAQGKDKNRVQDDVGHRSRDHADGGIGYGAFASKELAQGIVAHGEKASRQQDPRIVSGIGDGLSPGPQKGHDGIQGKSPRKHQDNAHEKDHLEAQDQGPVRLFLSSRPHASGYIGGAPVACDAGQGDHDHKDRIGKAGGRQLIGVSQLSDKIGVHQVVGHHKEHAEGDGKTHLQDRLPWHLLRHGADPPVPAAFHKFFLVFAVSVKSV